MFLQTLFLLNIFRLEKLNTPAGGLAFYQALLADIGGLSSLTRCAIGSTILFRAGQRLFWETSNTQLIALTSAQ